MNDSPTTITPKPSRLWVWFLAAFVWQVVVWTAWIVVASHHRVAEVPITAER